MSVEWVKVGTSNLVRMVTIANGVCCESRDLFKFW